MQQLCSHRIMDKRETVVVSTLYGPPNGSLKEFENLIGEFQCKINHENKIFYLMGDLIDLLLKLT